MSKESPASAPKRPMVSIPFLIGVSILGIAAYFAGPTVMTYVMYLQEQMIASSTATDDAAPRGRVVTDAAEDSAEGNDAGGAEAGRGAGSFDPERRFTERDADGNGKLEGEEISERMKQGLAEIDTDKDGAVSKEEFMKRMEQMAARANANGSPAGPYPETPTAPAAASDSASADSPPAEEPDKTGKASSPPDQP